VGEEDGCARSASLLFPRREDQHGARSVAPEQRGVDRGVVNHQATTFRKSDTKEMKMTRVRRFAAGQASSEDLDQNGADRLVSTRLVAFARHRRSAFG